MKCEDEQMDRHGLLCEFSFCKESDGNTAALNKTSLNLHKFVPKHYHWKCLFRKGFHDVIFTQYDTKLLSFCNIYTCRISGC